MPPKRKLIVILKSEQFKQPFKQTTIPGKGQGLVATRDIPEGSRVLSETPILVLPGPLPSVADIFDAYSKLSQPQKESLRGLHGYLGQDQLTSLQEQPLTPELMIVLAVFTACHINGNVFLKGSRINHSCYLNLEHAWNANLQQGTFHAIRNIVKDEELTISYVQPDYLPKTERHVALERWPFECECLACQDTIDERVKEEYRDGMQTLVRYLDEQDKRGEAADWEKCESICHDLASTPQVPPSRWKARWFHNAAKYAWRQGDLENVEHWIKLELKREKICVGIDHPDYIRSQHMLKRAQYAIMGVRAPYKDVVAWLEGEE